MRLLLQRLKHLNFRRFKGPISGALAFGGYFRNGMSSEPAYGIFCIESFWCRAYALTMRHKVKTKKTSPGEPAPVSGSIAEDKKHTAREGFLTRLRIKVGPPEQSWSHAKWLALADQALQD